MPIASGAHRITVLIAADVDSPSAKSSKEMRFLVAELQRYVDRWERAHFELEMHLDSHGCCIDSRATFTGGCIDGAGLSPRYNKSPRPTKHLFPQHEVSCMTGNSTQPQKTRERIEDELLEDLQQKQAEWTTASEDNRDLACRSFRRALQIFNDLVLYNRSSKDSK